MLCSYWHTDTLIRWTACLNPILQPLLPLSKQSSSGPISQKRWINALIKTKSNQINQPQERTKNLSVSVSRCPLQPEVRQPARLGAVPQAAAGRSPHVRRWLGSPGLDSVTACGTQPGRSRYTSTRYWYTKRSSRSGSQQLTGQH